MNTRVFLTDRTVYDLDVNPTVFSQKYLRCSPERYDVLSGRQVGGGEVWVTPDSVSSFHGIEAR